MLAAASRKSAFLVSRITRALFAATTAACHKSTKAPPGIADEAFAFKGA